MSQTVIINTNSSVYGTAGPDNKRSGVRVFYEGIDPGYLVLLIKLYSNDGWVQGPNIETPSVTHCLSGEPRG